MEYSVFVVIIASVFVGLQWTDAESISVFVVVGCLLVRGFSFKIKMSFRRLHQSLRNKFFLSVVHCSCFLFFFQLFRAATIISAGEGIIWALDRVVFRKIVLKAAYNRVSLTQHVSFKIYEALWHMCFVLR